MMNDKIKSKVKNRHIAVLLGLGMISILVEIFLCNANSFRLINHDRFAAREYTLEDLKISGADVDLESETLTYRQEYGSSIFIEMDDINTCIGNVCMEMEIPNGVLQYVVAYTDETNAEFYRSFEREYVSGVEKTKWFTCHLRGQSQRLILRIDHPAEGYTFALHEIQINKPIPLMISWLRAVMIWVVLAGFYGIRHMAFFQCRERGWQQNMLLGLTAFAFVALAVILYTHSFSEAELNLIYNVDYVDALIKGQPYLDIPADEGLTALPNPYDTSVRQSYGIEYQWDTAYYNGKYYCYYGVVPVLLFFVPYTLLTGGYLQCNIVVLVSYCLYILLLDLLFVRLFRHCVPGTAFGIEISGMCILNAVTNLFFYAAEPTFYLVPYAVGLLFIAAGFSLFTSWYLGKRENPLLLFGGGICMALAVGCRPTLLLYTLLALPFGVKVVWTERKKCIRDLAAVSLPYLVIGCALAWFNYIRFDSVFEFGQAYQLTAQDQLHNTHSFYEMPILLWLGFCQPPKFSAVFPFVTSGEAVHDYAGNFYIGNSIISVAGIMPIVWILFSPTIWRKWRKEQSRFAGAVLPFTAFATIGMLAFELLNAGVEWRYTSELMPALCISALLLIAACVDRGSAIRTKVVMTILCIMAGYSCLTAFLTGISGEHGYMLTYHPEFYYGIERLFCFWK